MNLRHALIPFSVFAVLATGNIFAQAPETQFKNGPDVCSVTACSDHILRFDYRPHGHSSERTPVIGTTDWNYNGANITEDQGSITIVTPFYKAVIEKEPFTAKIFDNEGRPLLQTRKPYQNNLIFTHEKSDNFYGLSGYNRDSYRDGHYPITRNSGGIIEAQPQGGCGGPFIWSSAGYGIILDTDGGNISNANGQLVIGGCSKSNFEFYILVGTPREILASAGAVTGMPQLFPKWNTGFGQLEWGIDETEFKTHVKGYRDHKIPFDWFMIDFDWMAWGEDDYGEFRWGKNFPGGATGELGRWADSIGVKMTAITKPRIIAKNADGTFTAQGRYAEEHGFWYPDEEFFGDYVSNLPSKDLQFDIPACRQWWWEHLREGAFDKGMVGFLNDECDDSNLGGLYSLGNLSNIYMQQSIYEGQRAISDKRVWSINRTAYLGSQRYAYSIWSGDNYPTFADLRSQVSKMLTANNTLVPVWGFCMTAFWNTSPVTPELYMRSMQLGLFTPLYFLHGIWGQQKQPWFFGEQVVEESRKLVEMRYRLIPYAYSYDRVKHESMLGISRALVIDYPHDPEVADIADEFLFGDYILVAPVLDSAAVNRGVYLPDGKWISYADGKRYDGKRHYDIKTDNRNFTDIPVFIRQGAIIPTQDVMSYVGERDVKRIYLDIFPAKETTTFPLYDDDGETYAYEQGHYFKQLISACETPAGACVKFAPCEGDYTPTFTSYVIRLHNHDAAEITVGGRKIRKYDSYDALMRAKGNGWAVGTDRFGQTTYIKTGVNSKGDNITVKSPRNAGK